MLSSNFVSKFIFAHAFSRNLRITNFALANFKNYITPKWKIEFEFEICASFDTISIVTALIENVQKIEHSRFLMHACSNAYAHAYAPQNLWGGFIFDV